MNILIAPDSFKESLSAIDVCRAIETGFKKFLPHAHYTQLPMADGGDGTSAVLAYALGGRQKQVLVHDPLMRPITASYLLLPDGSAVIEVAEACGLHLLAPSERNPMLTTSFGVGELIRDALDEGATRLIIGLGGSATNDAGAGMLSALGLQFYDNHGQILAHGGAALGKLQRIEMAGFDTRVPHTQIEVACDVTNPLCGKLGASYVFAPQKGGTPHQIEQLEHALQHFATRAHHLQPDASIHQSASGAGAAGGLGFGLMAFCQAKLCSGFDIIAHTLQLSTHIACADIIITGEGQLDGQTGMGKVAGGISALAKAQGKPVIAICGSVDKLVPCQSAPFAVVMPSIQKLDSLETVLINAYDNVETTAANIAAAIRLGQQMAENQL